MLLTYILGVLSAKWKTTFHISSTKCTLINTIDLYYYVTSVYNCKRQEDHILFFHKQPYDSSLNVYILFYYNYFFFNNFYHGSRVQNTHPNLLTVVTMHYYYTIQYCVTRADEVKIFTITALSKKILLYVTDNCKMQMYFKSHAL